jgi:hypothetical protein
MKHLRLIGLAFLIILSFVGCNTAAQVENPPEFVEMYLDSESDVPFDTEAVLKSTTVRRLDDTTTAETTSTETPEIVYDGSFYSETDFEVIVVTNGPNYDLLFSVELTDSLLGACIYTDQSTLYKASSTIEVEGDSSYTTTITLTIPGSTEPDAYLSERTITLSKILFSRDTVDGTFPADIPANATTELLFEVHAREYFDESIGLPLRVNENGVVDIILTPESKYFAAATALEKTVIDLPETVNGYEIGFILLRDLSWVEQLSLAGASDDVFLLGDFAALTTLDISAFSFTDMQGMVKNLVLTGSFPALTAVSLQAMDRYDFFLGYASWNDNEAYLAFVADSGETLYDFPVLSTVLIDDYSRMGTVQIGSDSQELPFPALISIAVTDSFLDDLEIGDEGNVFAALTGVTLTNTEIGSVMIAGTKPAENPAATLAFIDVQVGYSVDVAGSLFEEIIVTDSTLGALTIDGGTINDSRLTAITFQNSTFGGDGTRLFSLRGSHPVLTTLNLSGFSVLNLQIGGIGSVFAALETINLSGITAYNLYIGDRDANFPVLNSIVIDDATISATLRIGGENVLLPNLVELSVTNSGSNTFDIGAVDLDSVESILIGNSDFTGSITIVATDTLVALNAVVVEDVTCLYFRIYGNLATYDLYVHALTATNGLSLEASQCQGIYVSETDPTTWAYYDYAEEEGIPVINGLYNPA